MPVRTSLDAFPNYPTDHYETVGRARTLKKGTKERGKQDTIWTVLEEPEKSYKKSKTNTLPNNPINKKGKSSKKTESYESSGGGSGRAESSFRVNPLLENELRNWNLPRVELWCRDPNCTYNQHLWGSHYTAQHTNCSNHVANYQTIPPQINIEEVQKDLRPPKPIARSRLSASAEFLNSQAQVHQNHRTDFYCPQLHQYPHHNQISLDQEEIISINSVPMGLNTNHNNHLPPHHHAHGKMHHGMNNLNPKKQHRDGHGAGSYGAKADGGSGNGSNFTNSSSVNPPQSNGMMTQTDTMASSHTGSSRSDHTNSTLLTINTSIASPSGDESGASSATDVSSGFDNGAINGPLTKVGHDIVDYKTDRSSAGRNHNGIPSIYQTPASGTGYPSLQYPQGFRAPSAASSNPYCANCSGVVPLNHLDPVTERKGGCPGEAGFWGFNKFQHPLQRDHSFHSVGGFTLNGQYNTNVKKPTMLKFCSSHKISLVVSTFSLLVTIGLLITLFLMKKRGMMDTMDS